MVELEKKAIFVPVTGIYVKNLWKKKDCLYNGHDYKFFTPKSYYKYNYILTSTYYELEFNTSNFHNEYDYPDDNIVIADSSGFQVASFTRKGKSFEYSPLQILRWMEANADIAMNLDIPPWDNFNASLKGSIENFKLFEVNRSNFDMKLYNVLHGKTLDEMKTWYEAVKEFESFNGWALGVRPANNVYMQVIGYLFLQEKGAKDLNTNFHMFGISGIKNMIVMAMLSNYFDSSITFDSSSYISGSRFKKFNIPKDLRHNLDFGRLATRQMKSIPCNCPVCSKLTIEDLYLQKGTNSYTLIPLHNLYQYIEVNRMINGIVSDDYAFTEYAKSVGEIDTINTVNDMLHDYESIGCTKTYEKYKHLMTLRNPYTRASNLSSFKPRVVI